MKNRQNIDSSDQVACARCDEVTVTATAGKSAGYHRISLKKAVERITSPAFRLHRYRTTHNRLLLGALCELDCSDAGDCST